MSGRSPAELIEEFVDLTNPQAKAPREHAYRIIEMLRSSGYEIVEPDAALVAERDALLASIAWACGEAPDRDGKWFGEHEPEYSYDKLKRPYWWRTRLRELASPASHQREEGK